MADNICLECLAIIEGTASFCSDVCYHRFIAVPEDLNVYIPEDSYNHDSFWDKADEGWSSEPIYLCLTAEEQAREDSISEFFSDVVVPFVEEEIPF